MVIVDIQNKEKLTELKKCYINSWNFNTPPARRAGTPNRRFT
jgi:hypothetical protein